MIKESEYFIFGGIKSSTFGIMNVSVQDGLYSEPFLQTRTINETKIRGKDKPYFFEITKDPKQLQLSFAFEDTWNDQLIYEVENWLNVEEYQPLIFSANTSKVYYAMPVESPELVHNGLMQGYVNITMRCDSPYSYSREMLTPVYKCTNESTTFEISNYGQYDIFPFVHIQKLEDGDITVTNLNRPNSVMTITSLVNGEELTINGENQIIETSIPNKYVYDNFNDFYLPLYVGDNKIRVDGTCYIQFQYRYQFIT